jgi:hypothetical protein
MHVYVGSVSLKGKTFECSTSSSQLGSGYGDGNYRHVQMLEKNTDGLWWLYFDPKEKKLRPELRGEVVDAYVIRSFPITNGKYSTAGLAGRFDTKVEWMEGLAWADAVETVYKGKSDEERAVILRRLAATEQSPIAGWAINLLGKVNPKGTTEFLKALAANEKRSAESHVVLDKTLSRLDSKWNSSDHWERLLTRWVGSPDLAYFNAGLKRLWQAGRNNEIDFALIRKSSTRYWQKPISSRVARRNGLALLWKRRPHLPIRIESAPSIGSLVTSKPGKRPSCAVTPRSGFASLVNSIPPSAV